MKLSTGSKLLVSIFALAFLVFAGWFVTSADANHAWGKYHWDRSTEDTEANPLILGNNFSTSDWDGALSVASTDWNGSVLKNAVLQGNSNSDCDPTNGQVELCNGEYGENGWLGIASIWATRGKSNHIVQGVVMVNDTYFSMPSYNSQSWRDFVVCQEVGHTFGLDHQDENFSNPNRGSCMDYTSDPDGSILDQLDNRHPNDHDYEMMAEIYAHLNSTDDGGSGSGNGKGNGNGKKPDGVGVDIDLTDPTQWGQAIRQDALGRNSLFERTLPNGQVLVTHVIWTLEAD